jgi:hypothetical protein
MDGYLSNKPKNFVDDPEKRYRQMRRAAQAKKLEVVDPKVEVKESLESPKETPPLSLKGDKPQLPLMGEQPQPECMIGELCTPDIVIYPS